jgi:hypothetical protein
MDPHFQLANNDATEQLLQSELSRRCTLRPQAGIRARRLWDLSFDIENNNTTAVGLATLGRVACLAVGVACCWNRLRLVDCVRFIAFT